MVSKSDISKLEKAKRLILSLFIANDNSPIKGKTILVKQSFIIAKEIAPEIDAVLEFYPYQIGPYSTVLAKLLNDWIREGVVLADKIGRDWFFTLSDKGQKIVNEFVDQIPANQLEEIRKMKSTTSEWGVSGILDYVYNRYPEYAITSRVRGEIINS
ncbi:MAG: hypothetical protein ACTSYJ_09405 [Candidatus Thorarchaeota archaeon]